MELINQIKEEAKKFFLTARGSHDWSHTERVYNLALHIGKKEGADMEILSIAAILHDIGRDCETRSKGLVCHAEKGASMAEELLKKYNIPSEKIEAIVHCISTHRFRSNKTPDSREGMILFDADKLDSTGAVGIGRAFLFAGETGAKLHNKDVDIYKTLPYTEDDTAWREFNFKLNKIKDKMLTDEGKRIALERHRFMADFFDRLNDEVDGLL